MTSDRVLHVKKITDGDVRRALRTELRDHYVYVMECRDRYKVGVAWDVMSRHRAIQNCCPFDVRVRLKRRVPFVAAFQLERMQE